MLYIILLYMWERVILNIVTLTLNPLAWMLDNVTSFHFE